MHYMQNSLNQIPDRPALCVKRDGEWKTWTYKDYNRDVRIAAKAFIKVSTRKSKEKKFN